MKVSIDLIKQLRDMTNASIGDCRKALMEANGDMDEAVKNIRKFGIAAASKKASRKTAQGRIESYVHLGNKIGVLVEVNCETDFVARNEQFIKFTKDIAMQITASNPKYIKKEDVPKDVIEKEKNLEQYLEQNCLLAQKFIRDQNMSINDYLIDMIAKTGENIVISRFARFELGQD